MKEYWDRSITFSEYLNVAELRLQQTDPANEYHHYYELGLQRMHRTMSKFLVNEDELEVLKKKDFRGKILIISEPWCGDASTTVPVLSEFFAAADVPVKIFLRDDDPELINRFLTNGSQSIPKVLIVDEDFSVKNSWGPRTEHGTELLHKHKESPEVYPKDQFYNDLQVYYAKNRGKDAVTEVLSLL